MDGRLCVHDGSTRDKGYCVPEYVLVAFMLELLRASFLTGEGQPSRRASLFRLPDVYLYPLALGGKVA